ncbi:MAG: hypothetical protein IKG69_03735, partial [Atopobiaceae bacterium]|nr:hypothetical protein [Atopobiaceae bacterium]
MEDRSNRSFKEMLSALLRSNRRHMRFVRVLAVLAAVVAFAVPLAFRQHGITMTTQQTVLNCHYAGNGAHTHNEDCYDADGNLVCPLPERPFHTHTASSYATERVLACGQEESAGHTHTDACYDEEGNLTCTTPETPGHTHTDACYETRTTDRLTCGMEETADEHVHGPACFKTVTVEEPDPEPEPTASVSSTPEEDPAPEQEFSGVLKDSEGRVVLVVAAKAPKGALPKGSTMRVEHVDLNKKDETGLTAQDKLDDTLRKEAGDEAAFVQEDAVDITFYDAKGNRVDPAKKVEVRITTDTVRTFSDQRTAGDEAVENNSIVVLHVVDRQHTKRSDAPDAELVRKVALVNQDEDDHSTGHEDTVRFEATESSPYVVARVDNAALVEEPDGDPADDGEGQDLEPAADSGTVVVTTDDDPATPAQSFSHRISGTDGTPLLQVNVYAPEGAFPLGTTMRVSWVDPSQVEGAVAQAVAERTDGRL